MGSKKPIPLFPIKEMPPELLQKITTALKEFHERLTQTPKPAKS